MRATRGSAWCSQPNKYRPFGEETGQCSVLVCSSSYVEVSLLPFALHMVPRQLLPPPTKTRTLPRPATSTWTRSRGFRSDRQRLQASIGPLPSRRPYTAVLRGCGGVSATKPVLCLYAMPFHPPSSLRGRSRKGMNCTDTVTLLLQFTVHSTSRRISSACIEGTRTLSRGY